MQSLAVFTLIVLPWMNPFAPGPSPATLPLLFSLGCATLLAACLWCGPRQFLQTRLAEVTAWAWLAAGLLSSGVGLLQYFGIADLFSPWISQTRPGEAFANLRQRNQFASLCNMALVGLLFLAWRAGASGAGLRQPPGRWPWLWPLLALVLAAGNAASASRTGTLQLLLVCGLFWWWGGWQQPRSRWVMVAAVMGYVAASFLLPWLAGLDPFNNGAAARFRAGDAVCVSRLTLWSNVLHLISLRPLFGWGWGELDYAHYMVLYAEPRFCEILGNAHNLPLHLAVELGIPVAMVVCGACSCLVVRARPWRETCPARQMAWGVLAVLALHSLLEYPLWYGPFQMTVGLCVLLLWRSSPGPASLSPDSPDSSDPPVSPQVLLFSGVASAAVLTALVLAALDYRRVRQIYLPEQQRDAAYQTDTVNRIRDTRLFMDQVRFAELSITPLAPDNARWTFDTAQALLHFSPEPRVIEKLIESAVMLGRDDEALMHLARYRAAFPQDYARWQRTVAMPAAQPPQ
ncbi:Wzy polymerase domain-containing protein [Polaromonas sp. YR568]|uniref:PglL family O-oligosaccharyltransferase n=1 Tax=Polaromonas sp. YR568 TaxID=1855301 RepID=UPI003137DD85